jgi:hypothetical protein
VLVLLNAGCLTVLVGQSVLASEEFVSTMYSCTCMPCMFMTS